jgi:hypothetical protein
MNQQRRKKKVECSGVSYKENSVTKLEISAKRRYSTRENQTQAPESLGLWSSGAGYDLDPQVITSPTRLYGFSFTYHLTTM